MTQEYNWSGMSPTKQEEYDASKDAFDPKTVYIAIDEINSCQLDLAERIRTLKLTANAACRALELEREKTLRLSAQVARWEAQDAK